MPSKSYSGVAAILFLLVAIAHVVRIALGASIIVAGYSVPVYASIIAAVVAGVLALIGYMVAR
jgi:hypothetical protein